jgi:hypothetical protein
MQLTKLERMVYMIRSGWPNEYDPFHVCIQAISCIRKRIVSARGLRPWLNPVWCIILVQIGPKLFRDIRARTVLLFSCFGPVHQAQPKYTPLSADIYSQPIEAPRWTKPNNLNSSCSARKHTTLPRSDLPSDVVLAQLQLTTGSISVIKGALQPAG